MKQIQQSSLDEYQCKTSVVSFCLPQENQTHKDQSQQEKPKEQLKVGSET